MSRIVRTPFRHAAQRLFRRGSWSRMSLEEIVARFGTPYAINDFMQVCFEYVTDDDHHGQADHWQDPEHTLRVRRGDCEDFAVFAHRVLELAGWQTSILCTFTRREGHALCVALDGAHAVALCNEGLRRIERPAQSDGLCEHVARSVSSGVYPERWEQCSWVAPHALRELIDGRVRRPFDPRYEWVLPDGGPGERPRERR